MPTALGPAFGLGAAALWGAADFSGGLATRRAAPAFVVAVAHGFSLALLLVIALFLRTPLTGFGPYGLLSGAFCTLGLIALYSALARGSMGISAALSGVVAAVIPVLFAWFRETTLHQGHASPRRLIGFAVAAVAIWLVAYTPEARPAAASTRPRALGLAACAGLCFGAMLILMHLAAPRGVLRELVAMRIASASVAVSFGFLVWIAQRRSAPLAKAQPRAGFPAGKILLLAMLVGLLDTSGNLLYLFASLAGRLDVAAVLSSLYPAGTILLAAWLLRERAARSQVVGMALALAAVALISF